MGSLYILSRLASKSFDFDLDFRKKYPLMKNSILGRIIKENQILNVLAVQVNSLNRQLGQTADVQVAQQLQQRIALLEQQIQQQGGDQKRANLIAEIEALTKRKLITYFSIYGSIADRDARIIEDFLSVNNHKSFDILIDSPGGFTDAAEKMIKICRMRTGGDETFDFRTIIVNQAKSAATLFALGSSKILLSKTAELGPVDPQIVVFAPNGERVRDSAHQIYYGSQKFLNNSNKLLNFFQRDGDLLLLSKYDPIAIKRAEVAINHTNDIIKKRIYTNPNLCSGYQEGDTTSIKSELKIFTEHEASHSHGRPIYFEDIKTTKFCENKFIQKIDDFFLNDAGLPANDVVKLEELLWELTIRSLEVVRPTGEAVIDAAGNQVGVNQVAYKLFESSWGLILTKDPLH
jgi:ATP-dependent protease ClpP protease subunit